MTTQNLGKCSKCCFPPFEDWATVKNIYIPCEIDRQLIHPATGAAYYSGILTNIDLTAARLDYQLYTTQTGTRTAADVLTIAGAQWEDLGVIFGYVDTGISGAELIPPVTPTRRVGSRMTANLSFRSLNPVLGAVNHADMRAARSVNNLAGGEWVDLNDPAASYPRPALIIGFWETFVDESYITRYRTAAEHSAAYITADNYVR